MEAVYQAGAKEAFVIETAAAAALGVNLPVYDPVGNMVIDIGGGTTNVAMLSLGGIVVSKSLHLGSLISMRPSAIICATSTTSSPTIRPLKK